MPKVTIKIKVIMVYHFVILSDEVDSFRREIEIDAEATFLDFHNIIMKTCKYQSDEMSSFFLCESDWTKATEITLLDMNEDPTRESGLIMEKCHLDDYIKEEKAKLMYCFDILGDRYLYIQLKGIQVKAHKLQPEVTLSKGVAPEQKTDLDSIFAEGPDLYGSDDYDPEELDLEGYQDLDDIEGGGY
ncbi:MAG: hypothetical protein HUJ97_09805 [Bacteroidales bacterium]|nr:hypothetical protein [Bacteroidales bacterium]